MKKDNFTPEQERAIRCIHKNVVVSAGAGSGKTRVLVERFLYILEYGSSGRGDGPAPLAPGILAVTFTRKAAAEMRQRIRKELLRRIQENEGDTVVWKKELKALPQAVIGTLHSLCSSLLRANPVECGLDPSFTVWEENEYSEFLRTQLRDLLRRQLREGDTAAVRLCEEYGSQSLLSQLFLLLTEGYSGSEPGQKEPYREALQDVVTAAGQLKQELSETLAEASSPANKSCLLSYLQEARQALSDLSRAENLRVLRELNGGLKRVGKNKEDISRIKELLEQVQEYPACLRAQALSSVWEAYLDAVLRELRRVKLETGALAFDDLEEMALELLSYHPAVLEKCRSQFRYIMVDEFQDTNRRQRQLIYLLAGGDKERLRDNRLFVVGDPKQSIYRFRGAEVSVFSGVRREIEANGGESVQLLDNFRTVEPILKLCNRFFPDLMGTDPSRSVFYEALQPHRELELKPELRIFQFSARVGTGICRQKEAEGLALRLKELHETEGMPYQDMAILLQNMTHIGRMTAALQKTGIPCAVVDGRGFYDRMEIRDLIGLFTFASNPHNDLALLAVLRSVYMGIDDEMLTRLCLMQREAAGQAAVRGEAKNLSLWSFWGTLLRREMKQAQEASGLSGSLLLIRARHILQGLQTRAALLNLPDFCRVLEEALHPETVLALQPDGEGKVADYRKFMTLARTFAVQKRGTVAAFAAWLRKMQQEQVREAAANAFSEDAVTLMTVHKSKGLEFPLVAVPFIDTRPQVDRDPIAWLWPRGLGISVRSEEGELVPSTVLQAIRRENREQEREEKARLLYVAMTRAENRLILTGSVKEKAEKNSEPGTGKKENTKGSKEDKHWLDWFIRFKAQRPEEFENGLEVVEVSLIPDEEGDTAGTKDGKVEQATAGKGSVAATASLGEADSAAAGRSLLPGDRDEKSLSAAQERIAPLRSCGGGRITSFSASALQEYEHCPRRYYYQVMEQIPPLENKAVPGSSGLPATVLGNIVHRTLEKLSRKAIEETPTQALANFQAFFAQAVEEFAAGRPESSKEVRLMLEDYIRAPLYQAFVQKQKYTEYGFTLSFPCLEPESTGVPGSIPAPSFLFTGIMDAIAINEDGSLEIVDYKSGQPPVGGQVRRGYAWQLAVYRLAAEKLLGARVKSVSLHFLRNRSRWTLPDEAYHTCLTEIRQVCRKIAGKNSEEEFRTELSACVNCPFTYLCRR